MHKLFVSFGSQNAEDKLVFKTFYTRASFFTLKLCLSPKCVTDHNTKTTPGKLQVNPVKD